METTTPPAVPTVRDRMRYLSDERIADHLAAGRVHLDGEPITDLDTPAPDGSRVTLK